jgi:hypothetical protein
VARDGCREGRPGGEGQHQHQRGGYGRYPSHLFGSFLGFLNLARQMVLLPESFTYINHLPSYRFSFFVCPYCAAPKDG